MLGSSCQFSAQEPTMVPYIIVSLQISNLPHPTYRLALIKKTTVPINLAVPWANVRVRVVRRKLKPWEGK